MKYAVTFGASLLAGCMLAGSAWGADAGPSGPIGRLDTALLAAMKTGKTASVQVRMAALAPAIDAAFDLPGILRAVVGRVWASLPPGQQQPLLAAFRNFTIASYAANFDGYDGQRFEISPTQRQIGADQVVATKIISTGASNEIDYQMRQVDGSWKAVDVLLEGTISNVAKQYSDFHALLTGGGAQKLIDALNKKTADLESGSTQ